MAMVSVTTAIAPNHFGCATIAANVSRGEKMTPARRANTLLEAGATIAPVATWSVTTDLPWCAPVVEVGVAACQRMALGRKELIVYTPPTSRLFPESEQ